eukprot:m51a1_g7248 hypothetical protein (1280) ;mRNA; r:130275-135432
MATPPGARDAVPDDSRHRRFFSVVWRKESKPRAVEELRGAAREKKHYFEVINALWEQFKVCDLAVSGPINLTVIYAPASVTRSFRHDLRFSAGDLIQTVVRELGKKVLDQDASQYELCLKGSTAADEFLLGRPDPYIALEDLAPLWLYSLRQDDKLELRRRPPRPQPSPQQPIPQQEEGMDGVDPSQLHVVLKVIVPEFRGSTTLRIPVVMPVESVMRAVNSYDWAAANVQYRPVMPQHLRYYGMYLLSATHGWFPLSSSETLASQNLPSLAVVVMKRRQIVELEYQTAVGAGAHLFKTSAEIDADGATPPPDTESRRAGRRPAPLAKVRTVLSLDNSIPEAADSLCRWVDKHLGHSLLLAGLDAPQGCGCCGGLDAGPEGPGSATKQLARPMSPTTPPALLAERPPADFAALSSSLEFVVGIVPDDSSCDSVTDSGAVVRPVSPGASAGGETDDADYDDLCARDVADIDADDDAAAATGSSARSDSPLPTPVPSPPEKPQRPTSLATTAPMACMPSPFLVVSPVSVRAQPPAAVVAVAMAATGPSGIGRALSPLSPLTAQGQAGVPRALSPLTLQGAPGMSARKSWAMQEGVLLKLNGALLSHGRLEDYAFVCGDFMEVRYRETAIQFVVRYTPNTELFQSVPSGTTIEFDGEVVLLEEVRDVRHVYTQTPPDAGVPPASVPGTLFVTNYQLVFRSLDSDPRRELRVPLGLVARVDKVGGKAGPLDKYCLDVALKDNRVVRLGFAPEQANRGLVAKELCQACFVQPHAERLFAFKYRSAFGVNGWLVYDAERELARQGVPGGPECGWKLSLINRDYSLCDTYPRMLAVPAAASDAVLLQAAAFRSRGRLPVLCWRDAAEGMSITRCSQPRVGWSGSRSNTDEEYVEMVRATNTTNPKTLWILDSRPKANAVGNRARGGGYEDTACYPNCILEFEGIANIHAMRESYAKLKDACDAENALFLATLDASKWLEHMGVILTSICKAVDLIHNHKCSVLLHCSDGWDRTAQCSSLAQLCLDPYYRSLVGFEVLLEKEWLSFGHKFEARYGHGDGRPSDQRSPIFPQFVDCVYQLTQQFPFSFQFNEKFLVALLDNLYSCRFGTFLFNSEKERVDAKLDKRTTSLWSYINSVVASTPSEFINPLYTPGHGTAGERVLFPDPSPRALVLWKGYHLRWYYKRERESNTRSHREQRTAAEHVEALRERVFRLQAEVDELRQREGEGDRARRSLASGVRTPSSRSPVPPPSPRSASPGAPAMPAKPAGAAPPPPPPAAPAPRAPDYF